MPEVDFHRAPQARLEGRYHSGPKQKNATDRDGAASANPQFFTAR